MPLTYDPPGSDALVQGELLADLVELRPAVETNPDAVSFLPIRHALTVVLTAVCDLQQDYDTRRQAGAVGSATILPYVLLGDLHDETTIRSQIPAGSERWRRVLGNQEERYHHFAGASVVSATGSVLEQVEDLFVDFRKPIAVTTERLYDEISQGRVARRAVIPTGFVHDLIQRFFSYQSRVGID